MLLLLLFEMNGHKNVQKESFIDITCGHIRNLRKLNYIRVRALIVAWNRGIDLLKLNVDQVSKENHTNIISFLKKYNQLIKWDYFILKNGNPF